MQAAPLYRTRVKIDCAHTVLRAAAARHRKCTTGSAANQVCASEAILRKRYYMSIESKDDFLAFFDERIRRMSKEVAAELVGKPSQSSDPLIEDIEAANIQKAL